MAEELPSTLIWECNMCTLVQSAQNSICEACENVHSIVQAEWTCQLCTFIQPITNKTCEMCENAKSQNPSDAGKEETWRCTSCTLVQPVCNETCEMCNTHPNMVNWILNAFSSMNNNANDQSLVSQNINENDAEDLINMGFNKNIVIIALSVCNNNFNDAMQYLIDYGKHKLEMDSQNVLIEKQCKTDVQQSMKSSEYLWNSSNIHCIRTNENICEHKVIKCDCFQRISKSLGKYHLFINQMKQKLPSSVNINNICNDITCLLNDFNHLIHCHSSDFEDIFEILIKQSNHSKICDLSQCFMNQRNHRDRSIDCKTVDELYFGDGIILQQILDRVHSHYFHSFDTGYKIKKQDRKNMYNEEIKIDDDHCCEFDRNVYSINNIIKLKQSIYANNNEQNKKNQQHNKFLTELNGEYSYGFRYFYWKMYEHNCSELDPAFYCSGMGYHQPSANQGSKLCDWYITPKYATLKDELLNNKIYTTSESSWIQLIQKAKFHIFTTIARTMKCVRSNLGTACYYEMKYNQQIGIYHLVTMMVYCNFDVLQRKFSETFRRNNENEKNEQLKERHRNFYFLGRYLRECVECFGMKWTTNPVHQKLFHGVNKQFSFSSLNAFIKCPLSTTTDYAVAANFCDNKGMILELDMNTDCWEFHHGEGNLSKQRLNCFDCSWVSDYVSEQEIFFIGGIYKFEFTTIIDAASGINYDKYVRGLRQMTYCMNNGSGQYRKERPKKMEEKQMVFRLLLHQIWTCDQHHQYATEFKCCPKYVQTMLNNHCKNITTIDMEGEQNVVHESLLKYKNGWVRLDLLMKLFPNVEIITANASMESISFVFNSILQFLRENENTKIRHIRIKVDGSDFEDMKTESGKYRGCFAKYSYIIWHSENMIQIHSTKRVSNIF
eukprot:415321_1